MSNVLPGIEVDPKIYWNPPKIWKNDIVFIIGGGPSLKGLDWNSIKHFKIIGANDAYKLGPFIDYNVFADSQWFRHHRDLTKHAIATMVGHTAQPLQSSHVKFIRRILQKKFTEEKGEMGWFGNTGMSCISLALKLGASKIRLLGFDMQLDIEGNSNYHGDNINSPDPLVYDRFLKNGGFLKRSLDKIYPGVEILNCNLKSAWNVFPKVALESVL